MKDAGKASAEIAKVHALTEFEKYRVIRDNLFDCDFDRSLALKEGVKESKKTLVENLKKMGFRCVSKFIVKITVMYNIVHSYFMLTVHRLIKRLLREQLRCDIFEDTAERLPHKIPTLEAYDASSGKGIPIILDYRLSSIAAESIL